jgi:hypothetical protein
MLQRTNFVLAAVVEPTKARSQRSLLPKENPVRGGGFRTGQVPGKGPYSAAAQAPHRNTTTGCYDPTSRSRDAAGPHDPAHGRMADRCPRFGGFLRLRNAHAARYLVRVRVQPKISAKSVSGSPRRRKAKNKRGSGSYQQFASASPIHQRRLLETEICRNSGKRSLSAGHAEAVGVCVSGEIKTRTLKLFLTTMA